MPSSSAAASSARGDAGPPGPLSLSASSVADLDLRKVTPLDVYKVASLDRWARDFPDKFVANLRAVSPEVAMAAFVVYYAHPTCPFPVRLDGFSSKHLRPLLDHLGVTYKDSKTPKV